MTALTGSRMMGDIPPFAAACFAAGLACGWPPVPMALGCALYGALTGWSASFLAALAGCAVCLAVETLLRRMEKARLAALRDALTGLEAFAAALLPGLALAGGLPYNYMTALLSSFAAALLAPALTGALSLRAGRKRLLPDERLSCALLVEMILIGLGSLPFCGGEIAGCGAVFVTLVLASRGPALGAMGGVACGAALALGSGIAPAGSALGL